MEMPRFNPLYRGTWVLTARGRSVSKGYLPRFNPLYRGTWVLTSYWHGGLWGLQLVSIRYIAVLGF